MAYKQQPKSPVLKALKGNQGRLPQHLQDAIKAAPESPAKQTTAGEFAHKKSIKDKEMGKSTKVVDKVTSALEAPFSDKTYSELKKEKRDKQKAKYNAKSPAKQTSPGSVTTRKKRASLSPKESNDEYRERTGHNKPPVGPKAEKPKTKKEVFIKKANKKRYK